MAFMIFFLFCLKKIEKVEKTGIVSSKFSLRCTPSVILGCTVSLLYVFSSLKSCNDKILKNAAINFTSVEIQYIVYHLFLLAENQK